MLYNLREDYHSGNLEIDDLDANPFNQFHHWFQEVLKADIKDANAMTLCTSSPDGHPSARVVLLKHYDEAGFTFFTNYESRKGQEMMANPNVALAFLWKKLHRQVRIEGRVEKLSKAASEKYFQSRPRGSQVGAWASPQSGIIAKRSELEDRVAEVQKRFTGEEVLPLPPFWGGFLVVPTAIEFWQGQPSRLHDRFFYKRQADGNWHIDRLAP